MFYKTVLNVNSWESPSPKTMIVISFDIKSIALLVITSASFTVTIQLGQDLGYPQMFSEMQCIFGLLNTTKLVLICFQGIKVTSAFQYTHESICKLKFTFAEYEHSPASSHCYTLVLLRLPGMLDCCTNVLLLYYM